MRICLVTPFAWSQPHDVNEHVAGHRGRRCARSGTRSPCSRPRRAPPTCSPAGASCTGTRPPRDVVAVGPAVPISRRSQMGVPVGVRANLRLALARGRFDLVHGFEPGPALDLLPRAARDGRAHGRDVLLDRPARLPAGALAAREAARAASTRCSRCRSRSATRRRSGSPATTSSISPGVSLELFAPGAEAEPDHRRAAAERAPRRARRPARAARAARLGGRAAAHDAAGRTAGDPARPRRPRLGPDRPRRRGARAAARRDGDLRPRRSTARRACCSRRRPPAARSRRRPASSEQPELAAAAAARLAEDDDAPRARAGGGPRERRSGESFAAVAAQLDDLYGRLTRRRRTTARSAARPTRSPTGRGSSPTCTCTPRGRSTARSTRPSSSTTPRPRGSARSPSPTTTSSAARSRRSTRRAAAT